MLRYDVLILGGGIAGLSAALQMTDGIDAVVVSKVHPLRSHSVAAQGGINAALANHPDGRHDTWETHAFDTIKGSDYLADQHAVERMCREAIPALYELEHMGVPFSRFPDGTIAQRPFGGGGFPRTCYAADRTGHLILHTLYEQCVRRDIQFRDEWLVCRLVTDGERCQGIIALDLASGEVVPIQAKAVVFATGGYGRVYLRSTNAYINHGSGLGIAYRAGIPLKDMEFVQFHPTSLYGTNILITEGARGEGGHLLNSEGVRFMEDYAPQAMELAPRDIVARAIQTEIDAGRGIEGGCVHLDLRHLGADRITRRLPGIREIAIHFGGIDPIDSPIPVQPAQHYSMGGIDVDERGETRVRGVYAAGECACVSVHGANRLGGNSLLETLVFGKIAGRSVAEDHPPHSIRPESATSLNRAAEDVERQIQLWTSRDSGSRAHELLERLKQTLMNNVGIFRNERDLHAAYGAVRALREAGAQAYLPGCCRRFSQELSNLIELSPMLDLAEALTLGALRRTETRGSHYRTDHTQRDDANWLKHTLATCTDTGAALDYTDVRITIAEPRPREY